jgi:glycerol-3-phosphate O-acyltransferase
VCKLLTHNSHISQTQLIKQTVSLLTTLKDDLFLWQTPTDMTKQVKSVLAFLKESNIATATDSTEVDSEKLWSLTGDTQQLSHIHNMAECIDESLQRLAIITSLVTRLEPLTRRDLEQKVVAIAKRLAVLNNITAPEFIDKKAQATLINTLREQGYIDLNEEGLLITNDTMMPLKASVTNLVAIEVLQSIARS